MPRAKVYQQPGSAGSSSGTQPGKRGQMEPAAPAVAQSSLTHGAMHKTPTQNPDTCCLCTGRDRGLAPRDTPCTQAHRTPRLGSPRQSNRSSNQRSYGGGGGSARHGTARHGSALPQSSPRADPTAILTCRRSRCAGQGAHPQHAAGRAVGAPQSPPGHDCPLPSAASAALAPSPLILLSFPRSGRRKKRKQSRFLKSWGREDRRAMGGRSSCWGWKAGQGREGAADPAARSRGGRMARPRNAPRALEARAVCAPRLLAPQPRAPGGGCAVFRRCPTLPRNNNKERKKEKAAERRRRRSSRSPAPGSPRTEPVPRCVRSSEL